MIDKMMLNKDINVSAMDFETPTSPTPVNHLHPQNSHEYLHTEMPQLASDNGE